MSNHTLNIRHFPWPSVFALLTILIAFSLSQSVHAAPALPEEYDEDQIEIIEGEDRIIYEYRQNGVLTMIKIVPERGRPYYMVPADGSPHYEGLDHKRKLYPQWVIVEW